MGKRGGVGLPTGFFKKHNRNKSKKRKASAINDDDDDNAAADAAATANATTAAPDDAAQLREVAGGAAVDRFIMPALEDLTVGQWMLRVTRLEVRCGSLAALLIMNGVEVPLDLLSVSTIPWRD